MMRTSTFFTSLPYGFKAHYKEASIQERLILLLTRVWLLLEHDLYSRRYVSL